MLSRIAYCAAGVRFDAYPLKSVIQLEPEHLLQHDLLRTLWNLHAQPPAFNAFVGLLLHVPGNHAWVFGTAFVAMGLALTLTMFALMLELGASQPVALVMTSLFVVSPATVLNENWLFYGYPVALILCGAALCFARFARTQRIGFAVGFGSLLALLALSRASYHLVFVVAAGACAVAVCARADRRRVLAAVGLPLVLVGGLYLKNWVQFGEPTSSTWLGMNLAHMMFQQPTSELRADVAAHHVSSQALIPPFSRLNHFPHVVLPHTGVPALDIVSDHGRANLNNRAYIAISNQYLKDALHFIARHPQLYVERVADSFRTAFTSASEYLAFRANRSAISGAVGLQNRLLGQVHDFVPLAPAPNAPRWDQIAWLVVLQYAAVIGAGAVMGVQSLRRARRRLAAARATFLFVAGTVAYSVVASNVVELGENNRFRFETDPLVCAAVAALITAGLVARRRRTAGAADFVDLVAEEGPIAVAAGASLPGPKGV